MGKVLGIKDKAMNMADLLYNLGYSGSEIMFVCIDIEIEQRDFANSNPNPKSRTCHLSF